MGLNEGDIRTSWEGILGRDEYHLRIADVRDSYPDRKSLVVPYPEIDLLDPALATDLLEHPDRCLSIGESVIRDFLPGDWEPGAKINLRITELPRDARVDVRDIRAKHLGRLIAVEGMVRKATVPKPRLTNALFRCAKCDTEMWVPQTGMLLKEPRACASEGCNGNTFILDERMSRYIDTQKIEVQENPEGLRGGAQPERMSGFIDDDIAGLVTPGNRITMNGVLRSVQKTERDKSTIFETFLDVLSVEFEQSDFSELEITDEDEAEILRMAADPDLTKKIVRSISPTIFGLDREKEAVALQLFGGSHILMDDGTSIRGDIHILLIGDPGVAKSQLLRYMSSLSPRGIYASGKSASAAGLCVSGETELLMDEGERARIGDLVESRIGDSPEEYRHCLEIVEGRAKVLQDLITSFYDLSRIEGGEYPLELQSVDLRRRLEPLLAGFYEDFEQAGFQVTVELMESPPAVSADPGAVTRILTNLIGNALKHGSKTLDIRLYQEGQTLVTSFSNDAPELTQEDLPRVFERFYTADQMRTGQNTGLGLAIVKALSEQMGHTAFAELKDGVFTVGVRWKL